MRLGIFGSSDDPQVRAVGHYARERGAEVVVIASDGLARGQPLSFRDAEVTYQGESISDLRAFYVRAIPLPSAPALEKEGEWRLHDDWFAHYMQSRERSSIYLAWLLECEREGARIVNAPQAGSVLQLKPLQLYFLRKLGAATPATVITNDPDEVRSFARSFPEVIYKPVMGGALTRLLDEEAMERLEAIRCAPVIFQERVWGEDIRVIVLDGAVLSAVSVVTPEQHLDFRDDSIYQSGQAEYRETQLPPDIASLCCRAAAACGLRFAGLDLKHRDGNWVFLELNSSPIYLDVERKMGHPISKQLADYLIDGPAHDRH